MVAYGCHSKIDNCLSIFIVYFSFLYIFFVLIYLICCFFFLILGRVLFLCGLYRKLNFIFSENVLFCLGFTCDEFYFQLTQKTKTKDKWQIQLTATMTTEIF